MQKNSTDLPNDIVLLQQLLLKQQRILEDKDKQIVELTASYHRLLEQFRLAQQKRFGRSSEGRAPQDDVFNEAEALIDETDDIIDSEVDDNDITVEDTQPQPSNKPKRKPLPRDLPREQVIYDIEEADKQCQCCGDALTLMGKDVSEKLKFIPAQIKVIEQVRLKYSCQQCQKQDIKANIKQAPVPASPIPKGYATSSLLSQIITSKYQYALPLYRQEMMFKQHGIELNRRTMADWMVKCAHLLRPLYGQLQQILLSQSVLQADETTLKVINDERAKSYIWVYCSGGDSLSQRLQSDKPRLGLRHIVLFDYQDGSRAGACAANYLDGYQGYLQTDGYSAYNKVDAKHLGCWAHARRKFIEVEKIQGKHKTGKTTIALNYIGKLYGIEKSIAGLSAVEKKRHRQKKSRPILDKFKIWLDNSVEQVSKSSKLGEAINYSLNQWDKLTVYIENGLLNIDNNRAERAIKPFVIGRKNWLFSINHQGAETSAMLYSMIETAKANDLIVFDYLSHCLTELAKHSANISDLLPWNVKLS